MTSGYSHQGSSLTQRHNPQTQNGAQQHYSFAMTHPHPAQNGQAPQLSAAQQQQPPKPRHAEPQRRQASPQQSSSEMVPTVANEFVGMYYNRIFNNDPGSLFKFYMENSTFSLCDESGVRTARGITAIRKLFQELLQDVQARLDRFVCQLVPAFDPYQQGPPVLIQASGVLSMKGRQYAFSQSFILVNFTQNGYYVQNDIMQLIPSPSSTPAATKAGEFASVTTSMPNYALPPQTMQVQATWAVPQSTPQQVLMPSMDPVMASFTGVPVMNGAPMAPFTSRAVQQPTSLQNGLQPSMKVVAPPPAAVAATPVSSHAMNGTAAAPSARPAPIAPPPHQPPPPAPTSTYDPPGQHVQQQQQQPPRSQPAPPHGVSTASHTHCASASQTQLPPPAPEVTNPRMAPPAPIEPKPVAVLLEAKPADQRKPVTESRAAEARVHSEARTAHAHPNGRPHPEPQLPQPTSWASVAKSPPQLQLQPAQAKAARASGPSAVAAVAAATAALGTTVAGKQVDEHAMPQPLAAASFPPAAARPAAPQPAPPASRAPMPPPPQPARTTGAAVQQQTRGSEGRSAQANVNTAGPRRAEVGEPSSAAATINPQGPKSSVRGEGRSEDRPRQGGQQGSSKPKDKTTTLVLHDLPEGVAREELVEMFACYGTITAPSDFELEPFKDGLWHAFIPFATREAVEAAVQASHKQPVVIRGAKVTLKMGSQAAKELGRKNGSRNRRVAGLGRDHTTVRDQQMGSQDSSMSSQGQQGGRGNQEAPRHEAANGSAMQRPSKGPRREDGRTAVGAEPRAEGTAERRRRSSRNNRSSRRRGGSSSGGQPAAGGAAAPQPALAAQAAA